MFEDPGAQGEADDVYNGILCEIGLEYNAQGATVPSTKIAVQQQEEVKEEAGQEDELEARLNALRMA